MDPVDARDASPHPRDASADAQVAEPKCPVQDPRTGDECTGTLRCRLQQHGDCSNGTGGTSYEAHCLDGAWKIFMYGGCPSPEPPNADDAGADAGS